MDERDLEARRWRVKRAFAAHQNPYFRVVRAEVERPDGTPIDYHTIDFPRPAVAIALRRGGATLLVRQQRFIVGRDVWALPSGGVEPDEAPAAAAARELVEETGYRAGRLAHLVSYYPSYGVGNQAFHCYLAEDPEPERAFDANEVERVAWFDDAAIRQLIAEGEIPDGLSLVPLLHLLSGLAPQPDTEVSRCRRVRLDAPEIE